MGLGYSPKHEWTQRGAAEKKTANAEPSSDALEMLIGPLEVRLERGCVRVRVCVSPSHCACMRRCRMLARSGITVPR